MLDYFCSRCRYSYSLKHPQTYSLRGRSQRILESTTVEEYSYVYTGGKLMQMVVKTTTTPAGGTATTVTETLNFTYDASGIPMSVNYNGTNYYYVANIQGDIMAVLNTSGSAVVEYTYDAWGKLYSTTGTLASTLGEANPLTYRGYVYDHELGFYYLQSRYYNPEVGRFLNADGLLATGQGLLGNNMFAYCNNNPVLFVDDSGFAPWPTTVVMSDGSGAPAKRYYKSADEAAIAFAWKYYKHTRKEGIEYGAYLYSVQCGNSTLYTYAAVHRGDDSDIILETYRRPANWTLIGSIHTHPNNTGWSDKDKRAIAQEQDNFTTYVVFSGGGEKFIIWGVPGWLIYPNPVAGASVGPVSTYSCIN